MLIPVSRKVILKYTKRQPHTESPAQVSGDSGLTSNGSTVPKSPLVAPINPGVLMLHFPFASLKRSHLIQMGCSGLECLSVKNTFQFLMGRKAPLSVLMLFDKCDRVSLSPPCTLFIGQSWPVGTKEGAAPGRGHSSGAPGAVAARAVPRRAMESAALRLWACPSWAARG